MRDQQAGAAPRNGLCDDVGRGLGPGKVLVPADDGAAGGAPAELIFHATVDCRGVVAQVVGRGVRNIGGGLRQPHEAAGDDAREFFLEQSGIQREALPVPLAQVDEVPGVHPLGQ